MNEKPVLTNKDLIQVLTEAPYNFTDVWKYYKDGKSWLCRILHKKKTVFWLSVWDGYFKAGFYFTEKHEQGIADLEIDEKVKEEFKNAKLIGKLKPLVFTIEGSASIADILQTALFKIKS